MSYNTEARQSKRIDHIFNKKGSFWSEINHEMHSLRYKNALSELFQSFKGWKFSGVEKQKKPVTTENIKKHEIGIVRSYFGTTESHQSRQSHQSR